MGPAVGVAPEPSGWRSEVFWKADGAWLVAGCVRASWEMSLCPSHLFLKNCILWIKGEAHNLFAVSWHPAACVPGGAAVFPAVDP